MRLGLLETVGLAASLVFAIPLGIYAAERLLGGETLIGGAFLAVAVLMVLLPKYLTTPGDLPGKVAERAVGGVVADPEDEEK
ncbi:DUF7533 family protein [Halolamina salifodinae]|uniref:Uncharacterized protein n=1 Tax=Halolamina salifodinae TaxID=1202767 RepID=A0A8T4GRK5_9EURY|nr:hypothetical protein [Halolamina salifodinae]MBP1985771.1 hypothetical protein [Halolamina salifodinae]